MSAVDRIGRLTFDLVLPARASMEDWADWVQTDLLPVLEDKFDQARAAAPRRFERLDIDLGTVTATQAPDALARELALELALQFSEEMDAAPDLLQFLRTGTVPWTAWDDPAPHQALLHQALAMPDAAPAIRTALRTALQDDPMRTRLCRQFDSPALSAAAAVLSAHWPAPERQAALAWGAAALQAWQQAGGATDAFWRWFLPQLAQPVSPAVLQVRWTGPAAPASSRRLTAAALRTIGQGLEQADFALLAPYWDSLLASAPQCLRTATPQWRARWAQAFDAATLADIFGILQPDCAWLIERLATQMPRDQLDSLLQPALAQWLAAPPDSLAPVQVLAWITRAWPAAEEVPRFITDLVDAGAPQLPALEDAQLEQVLVYRDVAQLQRIWPSVVLTQRDAVRRAWPQLSSASRMTLRDATQPLALAVVLQPSVAPLLAELTPLLAGHPDGAAILDTVLHCLLDADVASVTPGRLMQHVLAQHPSFSADGAGAPSRHVRAALAWRVADEPGIALAAAHLSAAALRAYLVDQRDGTQPGTLNVAQLHGLVQAWTHCQRADGAAPDMLLAAVEARALEVAAPQVLFSAVLQHLVQGDAIDLDAIAAGIGPGAPAPVAVPTPREVDTLPVRETASPLSALLRQALPQRLADAMLRADLSALDALWPAIVRYHPDLLHQAAHRYLHRAAARDHLIDSVDAAKMHDLLACVSAPVAQLVAPLLCDAARFGALLPVPLAPRAFGQHVLRCAFAQVMDAPAAVDWPVRLLRTLAPAEGRPTLHAWYEVLRDGATALKVALEQALFGSVMPETASGVDTLSILLMRECEPERDGEAAILLATQRVLAEGAGSTGHATLHSALSHHRAIDRLVATVPGPMLARLLCELQPAQAAALPDMLPALLPTMRDGVPDPLPPVAALLDGRAWQAIFAAVFADATLAPVTTAGSPTPAAAMAQLLRPLHPSPRDAQCAPASPVPFNGESNLRNAGLVLIAPYIERLFGILEITRDGAFVSDATRQRGVHVLQYAITGEGATPEYLLALNKLLCGVPAAMPTVPGIDLTDKEKDTIVQLLGSVIAHWSALGACTVAGLRETFLQREGRLAPEEEAWHLAVPQGTFDMLLDRLPWGYKLIKFAWMAAPLRVTWR